MVDRIVLVEVIALAGEENEVYALIQQALDVAVRELGGIADGVAGHGVLAAEIQLAGGLFAEHDLKPAAFEKSRPQRQLLVKAERERQPDPAAPACGALRHCNSRSYL